MYQWKAMPRGGDAQAPLRFGKGGGWAGGVDSGSAAMQTTPVVKTQYAADRVTGLGGAQFTHSKQSPHLLRHI